MNGTCLFDSGVDLDAATAARPVRGPCPVGARHPLAAMAFNREDLRTAKPKRLYYLSMEFLIGRSLPEQRYESSACPLTHELIEDKKLNLLEILEQEPDAGLGNGGLGRLAACFMESAATCSFRPWDTACAMNTASSDNPFENGWQQEMPDNWLRSPDPWEIARPNEKVEVNLGLLIRTQRRQPATRAWPSINFDWHPI